MLKRRALSEREHLVNEHSDYGARLLNAMLTVLLLCQPVMELVRLRERKMAYLRMRIISVCL